MFVLACHYHYSYFEQHSRVTWSVYFALMGVKMDCIAPLVMFDTHERVVQSLKTRNVVMTASTGVNFTGHITICFRLYLLHNHHHYYYYSVGCYWCYTCPNYYCYDDDSLSFFCYCYYCIIITMRLT